MATNDQNQEINAIDNLNTTLTQASEHVARNKKIIYWSLGIIVAIGVAACCWIWFYITPQNNNSWKAYYEVETKAANDTVAAVEYAKVADKYSSTDAGKLASLKAGEIFYALGNNEKASVYLQKFSTKDKLMQAQANVLLGDSYVNQKKYAEAISAYKAALRTESGNMEIAPAVLWKEANVYNAQKNYQEALNCYEQIKSLSPDYVFGNGISIDSYIARQKALTTK